ncbi:adhesion G-protein coupled receptor G2-like [Hydractinia symbiolongicarpus]|uniref:adhesion G-protein coupled receptor G2-like n=1 Tax=Hydractinia symbiolongicarpus TaxID=13093 RepID=UPI00254D0409|nr:adhesion G-protein coupled receptor G2-like [Hydractinia symbiolongicarpus]
MTILVFVLVRKYRQNLSSKILVCLCLSLLITMVIFLVGAERTSSRSTCQVISGLMQYFLLATFCWTAVEAFNLYMNFVVIFHASKHENGLFHRLASIAWCTPLVVVIITVGAGSDELGNDDLCVVHGYAFFFGLLLPICLILMGNVIVLIFALRGMRTPKTIKGVKDRHERILQLWRVFVCSTILGLTWAFAVLAIGDLRDIFQYLFSIFNSLQGFIIFLIFVIAHKDKRKEILKVLSMRSYGGHRHSMSVKSSSSGE